MLRATARHLSRQQSRRRTPGRAVRPLTTSLVTVFILAVSFVLVDATPTNAGDCEVYCDGFLFGGGPRASAQECLDTLCLAPPPSGSSCGAGSGTVTDCKFDGVSILPPPVCGNDVRERAEACDGLSSGCDQGFTPCEPDCSCPPGSTSPGTCGDNVVNLPGEECDGTDDLACPGSCLTDCTCGGECVVFCDGFLFGGGPRASAQECLDTLCLAPPPSGSSCGAGSGTVTDCKFDGVSILPPPVCGNDVRERAEACDGLSSGCDQGFTPCEPDCSCPPGSTSPGTCGDNVVNLPGEECDGADDFACTGQCQTDCMCPVPGTVCGDNVREGTEQCDGMDDAACPGLCQANCTCSGEPIPTVSEWGMVILMLSLLVGIKLKFGRRSTQGLT